ncbi:hypothetical protein J2X50_004379 [Aminobacter sp. BE322]
MVTAPIRKSKSSKPLMPSSPRSFREDRRWLLTGFRQQLSGTA